MKFDKRLVDAFYDDIKQKEDYPETYITELFLIGKITPTDSIKKEVGALIKNIASETIAKAFGCRNKIPVSGNGSKTIETLIAYGLKAEDLDLGKMFELLGYQRLHLTQPSLLRKINANLWIFNRLDRVKYLLLRKESFKSGVIPEEIGGLKSLEEIDIEGDYTVLPSSIGKLNHLKKLELEMSYLKEIPDSFQFLTSLEELTISSSGFNDQFNNQLELPQWIGKLTNLKKLELGYLSTATLSDEMFPPNLEELRVYRMHGLTCLPEQIGNLTMLRSFELHVCSEITRLPQSMVKLKNLETFYIGGLPKLEFIDGNVIFSPKIKNLRLINDIRITEPERMVCNLKSLTVKNPSYLVYLIHNPELFPDLEALDLHEITQYDSEKGIGFLPSLKHLTLWSLSDLPKIWGDLATCPNLKEIELLNSEFTTLPNLREFKGLERLRIVHCKQLEINSDVLPAELGRLEMSNNAKFTFGNYPLKIREVDVYATHFENFTSIGEVLDVQKLKLYFSETYTIDNQYVIEKFPASLEKIKNLEEFQFAGQIAKVETDFSALQKLRKLELEGIGSGSGPVSQTTNFPIEHITPFQAPNLTCLSITNYSGNNLEAVFAALPQVTSLELNRILNCRVLPVAYMKSIKRIKLESCSFADFNDVSTGINVFETFVCKNINDISIATMCTWKNMKELSLRYIDDEVNALPESLMHLNLTLLNLGHLRLQEIPGFIGEMKKLKVLYLDGFHLDGLPSSIAYLPDLEYLSIDLTRFRNKLADDFKNLQLKELRMFESKFSGSNMKGELYESLLRPSVTRKVRDFSFDEER